MTDDTKELIIRRRRQMVVHSCIYYHLNQNLISDDQWQAWANQLRRLQRKNPGNVGYMDEEFKDWDGSTGCHLPIKERHVITLAERLLRANPDIHAVFEPDVPFETAYVHHQV